MSISDDIDTVRERIGAPKIMRLSCDCGDRLVTINRDRALRFADRHWSSEDGPFPHRGQWLEGPARIRIKRLGVDLSSDWPWRLKDAERPHGFGHAKTVEAALALAERILTGQRAVVYGEQGETLAYRVEPVAQPASWHEYRDHAREYGIDLDEGFPDA